MCFEIILKSNFKYPIIFFYSIGRMQLEETHNLCRALQFKHDGRIVAQRKTGIRSKCGDVWNCPRRLRQEPRYASLSPEMFLTKMLRPYPESTVYFLSLNLM